MALKMWDAHVHLDFMHNAQEVAREAAEIGLGLFGVTVTPCGYEYAAEMLKADGIDAAVYNFHTIKPLDVETICKCAEQYDQIFTVEEHSVVGGLGEAVAGVVAETGGCRVKKIGVNDKFGQSAKPEELFEMYGLDAASVARQIKEVI